MFALYFVPYALMVGELGSAFKNSGGGVSSWIHETTGAKAAYYAGWTYWACHVTYIASKGSGGLKALSWMIFQSESVVFCSLWLFFVKSIQYASIFS
jgi:amino acid transporter